jgi:hypothetical protein
MDVISADGISIQFDREGGIIADLAITCDGRTIRPLHRAPWVDSGETLPDDIAPIERKLAGDFFCAPFAKAESGAPIHGWPANGPWSGGVKTQPDGLVTAKYALKALVSNAAIAKYVALLPGSPIVYQQHLFVGGSGSVTVGHHAMVHVPGGAKLSFSPKSFGRMPATAPETDPQRGRSLLAYPQEFISLSAVRLAGGGLVDASRYPFGTRHEDLVVLSEKPGNTIGWSAAVAAEDGFAFFALKDARMLPQTVLWMSNGGRFYPPWSGRHTAVLGIEEVASDLHLRPGETPPDGLQVAVELRGMRAAEIRYAFGAIPLPSGWAEITDIRVVGATLILADRGGGKQLVPFLSGFFHDVQDIYRNVDRPS